MPVSWQPYRRVRSVFTRRRKPRDLGPARITAQQVRDKLTAADFQNVQVTPRLTFDTLAFKDGRSMKFAVDAQSGVVTRMWDDDDDDD